MTRPRTRRDDEGDDEGDDPAPTSNDAPATPIPPGPSTFAINGSTMTESFDGAPTAPRPWASDSWDITVLSRNEKTFDELQNMAAMHGPACDAPPETHEISAYEDAVFQCKDHMMTAIEAGGYGEIILTPAALLDFTDGEAVVHVDVSTAITSDRDYWDVWITPFEDNVQVPSGVLNGVPRNGLRLRLLTDDARFEASLFEDGDEEELDEASTEGYDEVLEPDAARRDTFEIRLSRDHVSVGMPKYGLTWIDTELPELSWNQGVVQFAHHSYNPEKAHSPDDPHSNTWHWDNVEMSPVVPFTIIGSSSRSIKGEDDVPSTLTFDEPAPANAYLRFMGIGENFEISVDGGGSWQAAEKQWVSDEEGEEHFKPYWTAIPEGTSEVLVRAEDWFDGAWRVNNASIWSLTPST